MSRTSLPVTRDSRGRRGSDGQNSPLARALQRAVSGEVRFDAQSKALYATDGSNYRQVPIGVVVPRTVEDIEVTMALCREHGAPVLGRGGGTSLAGQCCNAAVVIDCSKYLDAILEVDPQRRLARVQPGVVLDRLREAAEVHGLTFGPDPATHAWCTLGGMIGNNACGVHALMAGKTVDNVESMEILLYDGTRMTVGPTPADELDRIIAAGGRRGQIYQGLRDLGDRHADAIRREFPDIPRRVSGYNLDELLPGGDFNVARALVGSESTCAFVLEATVRLVESPPHRRLVVVGYPDVFTAGDAVPAILDHEPIGLEVMNDTLIEGMERTGLLAEERKLLPPGGAWLLAEFGAYSPDDADARAERFSQALRDGAEGAAELPAPQVRTFDDPADERRVWLIRESGLGAAARGLGAAISWEGWEDSAVPPHRVGDYMRDITALWNKYGYRGAWYGHIGEGCVHTRNDFDLQSAQGIRDFRRYVEEAADLCVSYGGSLSGEHGDGQARGELLDRMFSAEIMQAFRDFKALWDPDGKMNPGKLIDAYPLDTNLHLGADFRPKRLGETHFRFPDDSGDFVGATQRCVGVGKCRKETGGTMCPSYMVTREEKHSTRGRAVLLFEMLEGEVIPATWDNAAVKDALDLCISCKGCVGDCPVSVDMATYKSEFLSHYYEHNRRPRHAYALGWIDVAARLASKVPRLANLATQTPVLRSVAARAADVTTRRPIPRFSTETFADWFSKHPPANPGGPQVILWPDTFTNYLHPEPGKAAVEVLEAAGVYVRLPDRPLCCGRPLYDYGMLPRAKRLLQTVLESLRDDITAGVPVVGLEPSCLAVFRDELVNLFPHDEDAKRLAKQSFTLSEYLLDVTDGFEPPKVDARAKVQVHCHQKNLWGMAADRRMMAAMGLQAEVMDSGCCGLAGSFGFEPDHYEVSMAMGERAVFPMVRDAGDDTLILADGFSCRTQIEHGTDRSTLHLAEVLRMGLTGRQPPEPAPRRRRRLKLAGAAAALGAAAGVARRVRR